MNTDSNIKMPRDINLSKNQIVHPEQDHSLKFISTSIYQMAANVFQSLSNFGDIGSNVVLSSTGPLVANLTDSISNLESLKGMPKVLGKLGKGGVGHIVSQQLNPTEEQIRNKGMTQISAKIDDLIAERQKNVELQINELTEILKDKNDELRDMSQKLKEVCSGKVSVEQAFPFNYVNSISESFFSLLGYKYPKKFNESEYKEWCNDLESILKSQEENNKQFISSIIETTESDQLNWKEDVEKLKTNNETTIEKSQAVEISKEFSRGALVGVVEILADYTILTKLKKSPMPMMMAMLVVNVLLSGLEVKTHPYARILEIDKTKSGGVTENHPLEFMKRLVNACGVSCLATMAIKLCPQANNLSTVIKSILVPGFGAGFLEVLNSTSSSEEDRNKILNRLTEDLTADAKAYLAPDNSKLQNAMDESALNTLLQAVKKIPDETVRQYLQQEIDKIQERHKNAESISVETEPQIDESIPIETNQQTEIPQQPAEIEELTPQEKLRQEIGALVVICIIWYLLMDVIPSAENVHSTKESEADKTSTPAGDNQLTAEILKTVTNEKSNRIDEQPQQLSSEKKIPELSAKSNKDNVRAMNSNEQYSQELARDLLEIKILEKIAPTSSESPVSSKNDTSMKASGAQNIVLPSVNEANLPPPVSSKNDRLMEILKPEHKKNMKTETDESKEPIYRQVVKQYKQQINDVFSDIDIVRDQSQSYSSNDLDSKIMGLQFKFNRIVELYKQYNNSNLPDSLRVELKSMGDEACNKLRAEEKRLEAVFAERYEYCKDTSRKTNQIFNESKPYDTFSKSGKSINYTTIKVDVRKLPSGKTNRLPGSQEKIVRVLRQIPK